MSENIQDVTMGNQQERPSEAELGWLAGILDGEGSVTLNVNSTKRAIYPRIWISSSEHEILDKTSTIIDKLGIKYGKHWKQPPGNRKPHGYVCVLTHQRVRKLLETLLPYITAKKERAEHVIEFCSIRKDLPYGHGYTARELELKNIVAGLQLKGGKKTSNGIPNDYTPSRRPRYRLKI